MLSVKFIVKNDESGNKRLKAIKKFVKSSKMIAKVVNILGSFFLNALALILPVDKKLVVFTSFSGRQFSDSPKVIYEKMKEDSVFKDYKLIWGLQDIQNPDYADIEKVKIDTFKYFYLTLRARIWVSNSNIERGFHYKNKGTFYLNTWHGIPIKTLGLDEPNIDPLVKEWYASVKIDLMSVCSECDKEKFKRIFSKAKHFINSGLPRNEILLKKELDVKDLKAKMGIDINKKVILYAPTFRDYSRDGVNFVLEFPFQANEWEKVFGDEYTFLIRGHYFVQEIREKSDYFIDVSDYPDLNELMQLCDVLISDYSSLIFDYAILGKPMISYCYDYELYEKHRGMYLDIKTQLPNFVENESSLIELIQNLNYENECLKTKQFSDKYMTYQTKYGSDKILDELKKII